MKAEEMKQLLPNIMDDTLKRIFIAEDVEVIYRYMETEFHLEREDFAERPEVFLSGLRGIIGSTRSIEELILKRTYSALHLKYEKRENYEFSDYLKELRRL